MWKKVWREGFAPLLTTRGLKSLRNALAIDDCRLVQKTTQLQFTAGDVDYTSGSDALAWCYWQGKLATSAMETCCFFEGLCEAVDRIMGQGMAMKFLEWYDCEPRQTMRCKLAIEIDRTLAEREVVTCTIS